MPQTDDKTKQTVGGHFDRSARHFAETWQGKGYEKGESQPFWISLLNEVLGIEHPTEYITFEQQVKLDHTAFIDAYIPHTHVMIEQKSIEKDLGAPVKQSDGVFLTPFQQAKRYASELPYSKRPRWIVTCNFREFWVYDMEQPNGEPQKILLENLDKEYYRLQFLVDEGNEHLKREMEVSVKAGDLVGLIYDKLLEQYIDKDSPETLRSLNILCVRLVFCLYAEDAGLFATRTAFHDYLLKYGATDFRRALMDLFVLLDTPIKDRDPYLEEDIAAFPYVNGGLFSEEKIIIPRFTEELRQLILQKASADFDWSEISPTIFGAVFESTLNPETRRTGGMHYTSIENIHKVIDPLFLNSLKAEFAKIQEIKQTASRRQALANFQDKLSTLTFLDPACGSGNFLTESFLSLRRLENEIIKALYGGISQLNLEGTIKVSISQFYGIEINDFACTVAKTALWIAENQMLQETSAIIGVELNYLPLKTNANIKEGNALRLPWDEWEMAERNPTVMAKHTVIYPVDEEAPAAMVGEPIVRYGNLDLYSEEIEFRTTPKKPLTWHIDFDFIMGNPPFVGARWMSKEQKKDVIDIFGAKWQGVGDLDYVCCWYKKAVDLMTQSPAIRAAFVSTNSICQGGSVTNLWKPLFTQFNTHIDFAYQTFRWDSEADIKAHVHCVIVGFSYSSNANPKTIYLSNSQSIQATNINGYLLDAPNMFIEKRMKPLCAVPTICLGGQPIDDGNLTLTEEEKNELIKKEPQAEQFVRHYMMGKDFIERKPRYCLWLQGANPSELRKCHAVMRRVEKVREFRLASKRTSTLRAAEMPTLFGAPFECESDYIAIPKVSSENRRYIPIDFLSSEIIPGDKLFVMQRVSLYHFGILTSIVHMAWVRATCGRLEMRYSYSNTIVYNNFPWPNPTEAQQKKIEQTAQAILDARAIFPSASLADLYDENTMPVDLRKAHQANDKAVMQAYGFDPKMTENETVAELFRLYEELINKTKSNELSQ